MFLIVRFKIFDRLDDRKNAMDTKYFKTLKAILETGSFQKAAQALHYTQSTVTFHVQQLERIFSIKLFNKVGRKMELTQIGREILPYVDTILQATEQIENYGKEISEMRGTLKLVAPDSVLIYVLQDAIQQFVQEAPNIQLIVNSLPSDEINHAVLDGVADIGINCDRGIYFKSIQYQHGAPFHACLVAAPDWNGEELDFITPRQCKNISMICNEPTSSYQRQMNRYLAERDIVLKPYMKMQSIEAVKRSVMNRLGVAYIPLFSVEKEIENRCLQKIPTTMDSYVFTSVILYHKDRWVSPQMKLFLQICTEQWEKVFSDIKSHGEGVS